MNQKLNLLILGLLMSTTPLHTFENEMSTASPPKMGFFEGLSLFKKVLFDTSRRPTNKLPEVTPDFEDFLKPSDGVKFIWFGHSSFILNLDGKIILVDPVFYHASPFRFLVKRFQAPVVKLDDLPEIDLILISHDHYDHLDKLTVRHFKKLEVNFLVPNGVGDHLRNWGVKEKHITELSWHESTTLGAIKLTAAPAQHFSGRGLFDRNKTLWASWVIHGKSSKIYYSGDTGHGPHFKEIGEKYGPFDFAFMENGQYNVRWPDVHLHPEQTFQATLDVKAQTLIPIHWGMFDLSLHHWTEPVERIYTLAKESDFLIITPRIGETVDENNRPSITWWKPFL